MDSKVARREPRPKEGRGNPPALVFPGNEVRKRAGHEEFLGKGFRRNQEIDMKTSLHTMRALAGNTMTKTVAVGGKQPSRQPFRIWPTLIFVLGILGAIALNQASASAADDEKTAAALDIQYQAAVKKNDADTMNRILADDFILVTGSGKTYTKADLLQEARGGRVVYEQQEDTDQTVRVWGDTAVVTARL
jgi:uncharacterized protein DUF4440